jgi:hypothetical protein
MRVAWSASLLAIAYLWAIDGTHASETVRLDAGYNRGHDRRLEQAAIARAAARIGDLRGGQSHDADIAELIAQPRKTLRRPMPAPQNEPATKPLPPMVMDETLAQDDLFVDPIVTGSNKKLAPVD